MTTPNTNDERPEASKAATSSPAGYGRPPAKHQFTKGKSGNPRGRPRKQRQMAPAASSSIDDLICAELNRPIAIRENDREVHLPAIQIALRALTLQAAKGSTRAQLAMARLLVEADERTSSQAVKSVTAVLEYKSIYKEEIRRCDELGKPRPEVLPHPDEIAINFRTGAITINGPLDEREKAQWDKIKQRRDSFAAGNKELKQERLEVTTDEERQFYDQEIATNQRMIDFMDQAFPSEKIRRAPDFDIHAWRKKQPIYQAELAKRRKSRARSTSSR